MFIKFSHVFKYLAVCNAGLVTGLQREILERFIGDLTSNYRLTMPPGKSYCFVDLFTAREATGFYDKVHGKLEVPDQNTVFYLLYIKTSKQTIYIFLFILLHYEMSTVCSSMSRRIVGQ